jgi:hypothetical protein
MNRAPGEAWFLASCVELYKSDKGIGGREAYERLLESGAVGFITGCWEGLHMTGPEYILDCIEDFMAGRGGDRAEKGE